MSSAACVGQLGDRLPLPGAAESRCNPCFVAAALCNPDERPSHITADTCIAGPPHRMHIWQTDGPCRTHLPITHFRKAFSLGPRSTRFRTVAGKKCGRACSGGQSNRRTALGRNITKGLCVHKPIRFANWQQTHVASKSSMEMIINATWEDNAHAEVGGVGCEEKI